ncbi:MAG: hypothetical protein M3H12_06120 [Chromatiales bacterium]|nr:hypothetical protein [endosymbiont of Lamellibrachia barhami]MBA1445515.1 hypothetical protein [Gammaproteobacteria bacterium]
MADVGGIDRGGLVLGAVARRFKQEEDRRTGEPVPDNVAYLEKRESGE